MYIVKLSEIMSFQILTLAIINGITGVVFFKYTCDYIYTKITKEKDEQLTWMLAKIHKLETEVFDLHATIDNLEETLVEKEAILKLSSDRIDKFLISNYDIQE
jgi:hypothetical protein